MLEEPIRSNNDVEGWHRRLNSKARQSIGFCSLLSVLEHEADMVKAKIQYLKHGSHPFPMCWSSKIAKSPVRFMGRI